jgi:hypothetical protein
VTPLPMPTVMFPAAHHPGPSALNDTTPLRVGGACADSGNQTGSARMIGAGEQTRNPDVHCLAAPLVLAIRDVQVTAQTLGTAPACFRCQATDEPLQTAHETLACVCASGVCAFAGGVGRDVACVARTTMVSARMQQVPPRMQVDAVRMQGLDAAATSEVSTPRLHMRNKRVAQAHATGYVASLYQVSARTSVVDSVRVLSHGVVQDDLRASRRFGSEEMSSCCDCNDTCRQPHCSWGPCSSPFGAIRDARRPNPASGGTMEPDGEACTWRRLVLGAHRVRLVSVRHLAHGPKADLWLAYVGPQGGHEQAQSCPSKHPDGYREVPF